MNGLLASKADRKGHLFVVYFWPESGRITSVTLCPPRAMYRQITSSRTRAKDENVRGLAGPLPGRGNEELPDDRARNRTLMWVARMPAG